MRESLNALQQRRLKLEKDCAEIREKFDSEKLEVTSSLEVLKQKLEQFSDSEILKSIEEVRDLLKSQ